MISKPVYWEIIWIHWAYYSKKVVHLFCKASLMVPVCKSSAANFEAHWGLFESSAKHSLSCGFFSARRPRRKTAVNIERIRKVFRDLKVILWKKNIRWILSWVWGHCWCLLVCHFFSQTSSLDVLLCVKTKKSFRHWVGVRSLFHRSWKGSASCKRFWIRPKEMLNS